MYCYVNILRNKVTLNINSAMVTKYLKISFSGHQIFVNNIVALHRNTGYIIFHGI